jgi:hypothetical protein
MTNPIRTCKVTIKGMTPYSASRAHQEEKLKGEDSSAYEDRTWMSKAHLSGDSVFIPPMAFKMGLDRAAKISGKQIPGKGKSTYTKFFESGVLVTKPIEIASVGAIQKERVHANADGVRGSGKRVWRNFPRIDDWSGVIEFSVIAPEIPKDVFEEMLIYSGLAVGVGRFRPEKGGYFGRFEATKFAWS